MRYLTTDATKAAMNLTSVEWNTPLEVGQILEQSLGSYTLRLRVKWVGTVGGVAHVDLEQVTDEPSFAENTAAVTEAALSSNEPKSHYQHTVERLDRLTEKVEALTAQVADLKPYNFGAVVDTLGSLDRGLAALKVRQTEGALQLDAVHAFAKSAADRAAKAEARIAELTEVTQRLADVARGADQMLLREIRLLAEHGTKCDNLIVDEFEQLADRVNLLDTVVGIAPDRETAKADRKFVYADYLRAESYGPMRTTPANRPQDRPWRPEPLVMSDRGGCMDPACRCQR